MRKKGGLVQPYRDIAALAGAQVLCFLVLADREPHFVIIHLYESILYPSFFNTTQGGEIRIERILSGD